MTARERALIDAEYGVSKRAVRDAIRRRPNGESEWQLLQADIYGELIRAAIPFPGLHEFVIRARELGTHVSIVSHKTAVAAARPGGADLPRAALAWLCANDLIGSDRIAAIDVHFEPSRAAKIARISRLASDIFIDDLVEVFTDAQFPPKTRRWLFTPGGPSGSSGAIEHYGSWRAMLEELEA